MVEFEAAWRSKLASSVGRVLGPTGADRVLGSDALTEEGGIPEQVERWTLEALARLEERATEAQLCDILSGCACTYPIDLLKEARRAYEETGDIREPHRLLRLQFEQFLRADLGLPEADVQWVLAQGWGLAGVLEPPRLVAIKIPKSTNLAAYLEEPDRQRRRELYCHCPRLRHVVAEGGGMPRVYCACGAGFYRGIWEHILGQAVTVRILRSVMAGDDLCQVEVRLPPEVWA